VDSFILEVLSKKGAMTDSDLLEIVGEEFKDIGLADFNRLLMNLEIEGKVYVSNLTKGKRRIEPKTAKQ
jgi:hypothetical protein